MLPRGGHRSCYVSQATLSPSCSSLAEVAQQAPSSDGENSQALLLRNPVLDLLELTLGLCVLPLCLTPGLLQLRSLQLDAVHGLTHSSMTVNNLQQLKDCQYPPACMVLTSHAFLQHSFRPSSPRDELGTASVVAG